MVLGLPGILHVKHVGEALSCTEEHEQIVDQLNDLASAVKTEMAAHEDLHHHPPLTEIARSLGKTPTELMNDFLGAVEVSRRVVDALEGPEMKSLDGSTKRIEEEGLLWQVRDVRNQLKNGISHKTTLTRPQWTAIVALIGALGTIAVALIEKM